ncbi:MAG: type 4a pilus biogenesis protein PilO, partial [Candidatus Omnitrophota bacterium]
MQPIEGKKRVALMAAVATLLVLADIFFVIIPLFGKVADLRGKVISRQEAIRSLREQIERIGKTKKTRDGLKQEQMFYYRRFPTEEEIPLLLNNLSVVAASSNVDIIALRPVKADIAAPTTKTAPYREVPLEIVAKGGYHHIG